MAIKLLMDGFFSQQSFTARVKFFIKVFGKDYKVGRVNSVTSSDRFLIIFENHPTLLSLFFTQTWRN